MDLDNFEIPAGQEEELEAARQKFIDEQEEVEASDECEGGACKL